ncbi:Heavy metal RND efflux outer membrane protein, CzcC family [Labilithrix luteola]|uniref:Heavy metal RND efflux outer membrane protein, CzcC family n=1 Tax=Labilithrix luteola TaxID=1391654 RepID=A0A0K1PZG4_9BACT|nr:TolC family protein [Labilithrix luteola]AKU98766.1 Heavy metal RND efflux outer membrane protein, CzcC family [Labilithrix luteola]
MMFRQRWMAIGLPSIVASCSPTYNPPAASLFGQGATPNFARETETSPKATSGPLAPLEATPPTSPGNDAGGIVTLQLSDVIRASVLGDPRIAASLENVRMAQGDFTTTALLPNPGLSIGQTLNPFPGAGFTQERPGGPPQLDIGLSYALDGILFGKRTAAMDSARRAVDVAAAERADLVRQRVLEAITDYYDVLQAKALFELAKEAHGQVKTLESITAQRVTLGSVGTIELDRVRLALLAAHRDMLRSEADVDKGMARIRARLGPAFARPSLEVGGSLELATVPDAPSLTDAMAAAEASRPDVIAAKRDVERAAADIKMERRNAYPNLAVAVGYTRQFQTSLGVPDINAWGVGVDTTLPLFNRNQGAIAKAEAAHRQSIAIREAVLLELRADVEQALREYKVAREVVTQDVLGTLSAAGAAREKVLESYRLGGKTLIEVLDAQNAYREAVRLTIEARAGFWKAKHSLNAALGKEVLQ